MTPYFTSQDLRDNKVKAGLGYLVFFLPLILCKDSKLGRYCANQGLLLLIYGILVRLFLGIFSWIPLLGWLTALVEKLFHFALVLVGLLCFLNLTTTERTPELPIIGRCRILS